MQREEDIKKWEADVATAKSKRDYYAEEVTSEHAAKARAEENNIPYKGILSEHERDLAAATEHLKKCEGQVASLKSRRNLRRLLSLDSESDFPLSHTTTADTESTAPTEWSCTCGESGTVEVVQGRGIRSISISFRGTSKVSGNTGAPGDGPNEFEASLQKTVASSYS
jgi:hypothetical protein